MTQTLAQQRRRWRLYGALVALFGLGIATVLVLLALGDSVSYFHTPSEIKSGSIPAAREGRAVRLGGLVEAGSINRSGDGMTINFRVTDLKASVAASYRGVPPDLFREKQGVVAEGRLNADGVFVADRLLAKHDENYMPPEVAKALEQNQP